MTRPAPKRLRSSRAALLSAGAAGALTTALICAPPASAAPGAATVKAGTASVTISPTNSSETDVTQTSQRAFIDWDSFNLSAGDSVTPRDIVAFKQAAGASAVTFNRINSATPTNIAGTITAPGAVWLFTPAGLIIGPSATINVGSFVASTGGVNFGPSGPSGPSGPNGSGAFLPLTDNAVSITGAKALIDVQPGASINASRGFVVLNSEQINQNGAITAADAVSFGLADASTINFTAPPGAPLQQLDSVTLGSAEAANATLNHGGSTTGAWIQVTGADEANAAPGLAGVINLTGVMSATGIAPSGTDQGSVMLVGVDSSVATPIDASNHSFTLNAVNGSIGSSATPSTGGVYFVGAAATLGAVSTQSGLYVEVDGALTLGGVTTAGDAWLGAQSIAVNAKTTLTGAADLEASDSVSIADNSGLSAAGSVTVNAGGAVTLGKTAVLRSGSGGAGSAALIIDANSVNGDATSTIAAGPATGAPSSDLSITADTTMTVGKTGGAIVALEADGVDADGASLTLLGPSVASVSFSAHAPTGSVIVSANISSQSSLIITAGDTITVDGGVTLQSNLNGLPKGGIELTGDNALDLKPTSSLIAGPDMSHLVGDITLEGDNTANVGLAAGASLTVLSDNGEVTLAGNVTTTGNVNVDHQYIADQGYFSPKTVTVSGVVQVVAGGAVDIESYALVSVGAGALLKSNAGGLNPGSGRVTLSADDLELDPTSSVMAGPDLAHLAGEVLLEGYNTAKLGQVAGGYVDIINYGDVTLGGNVTSASDIDLYDSPDTVTVNAGVTVAAGGYIDIESGSLITLADGAILHSNTAGNGGDVYLESFAIDAAPTSLMAAGPLIGPGTDAVTVYADGGDLRVGKVVGGDVDLEARGASDGNGGDGGGGDCIDCFALGPVQSVDDSGGSLSVEGAVAASGNFTALSKFADVHIDANVTAAGSVTVDAAGDILGGAGATIIGDTKGAGADMTLTAGGGVLLDATSALQNGATAANPTGAVDIEADGGDLTTGAIAGTDVRLVADAGDVTIGGAVYGSTKVTIDPTNVTLNANVSSGGGMDITADDSISLGAGVTIAAADYLSLTAPTISAGKNATLQSDSDGDGSGDLNLSTTAVTGGVNLIAGKDATHPSAGVSLDIDGPLELGGVTGDVVSLTSETADVSLAGASTIGTSLTVSSPTGSVTVSGVAGGGTIDLTAAKDVTLNGAMTTAGDIVVSGQSIVVNGGMSASGIDLEADDAVTIAAGQTLKADGQLSLYADTISVGANAVLQGDAAGTGKGGVLLDANTSVTANATSQLLAGSSTSKLTGAVTVYASGDVQLGQALGNSIQVSTSGDVTLSGAIQGVSSVSVDPGDLDVDADVSSGGVIFLSTAGGALTVAPGVRITSTGGLVDLSSDGDLTVGSGASVTGVSLLAETGGTLHLASGASLATTGQAQAPTWPLVTAPIVGGGEGPAVVSGMVIIAAGLDLQGAITAGQSGARDDVYFIGSGESGPIVVGGADSSSGFHLSNSAVGRITARNLIVMAGFNEGDGADIQVQDLTLNTAQLGALGLGADSSHSIAVTGAVSLQGGGKTDLHVGFALSVPQSQNVDGPPNQSPNGEFERVGYIPGEIDISGSLGSATAPFQTAVLLARDDIFMGSADFIAAAKADANFDAGKSSSAYPIDAGHVFLASHDLELGAEGRIIQQNTAGALQYAGLVFDAPAQGHELVGDPAVLDGKALNEGDGDGWTPNYSTGPTRVDLFGVINKADGTRITNVDAAEAGNLSAPAITDVSDYKINTCVFATRCLSAPPPRIEVPTDEIIQAQAAADASSASSTQTPTGFAQTIQIDDTSNDEKSANGAPVTGSGNGDLWSGPPSSPH